MHTLQLVGPIHLCVPAIGISAFFAPLFVHEFDTVAIIGDTGFFHLAPQKSNLGVPSLCTSSIL